MAFRRPDPNPRPSNTPAEVDWLVWQAAVHAAPALDTEIRRLSLMRNKLSTMLEERALTATQRGELTAILDALARRGIVYNGTEDGPTRDGDGRFIGGVE